MNNSRSLELKVGLFVTLGIALMCLAILLVGGSRSLFSRSNTYTTHFPAADGLYQGAKVVLGGVNVGGVVEVDLDPTNKEIKAIFTVEKKYEAFIRKGSEVEILTQGVLGDKYLSVTIGPTDAPMLEHGADLPARPVKNLTEVLSKSDQLVTNLTSLTGSLDRVLKRFEEEATKGSLFKNLSQTSQNLNQATAKLSTELDNAKFAKASQNLASILEKINNGTGTLGALVNDPGLYDDAKALLGGANRNRIVRNLVRKTVRDGEEAEASEAAQQQKKK